MRKIIILLELFSIVAFAQEKGSFTDSRDKKTYKTVKIGKQVWMAENLNYNAKGSKCGGTNNPETREKNYFAETFTTCTYYSLEDKNTKNCDKYGRLYDWSIAIKACPVGWHLPSDAEWQTLVNFAGGDKVAGTKLKAKSGWDSYTPCIKHENDGKYESEDGYDPDEYDPGKCVKYGKEVLGNGNDTYGFSALPGSEGSGCWNPYGEDDDKHFFAAGSNGSWWSSTEDNKGSALSRGIYSTYGDKTSGDVRKISSYKKDLFSVRCVQDDANYADIKANEQELKIEVTQDIISVNGKKIAKTSTVAKQDSLLIGTLYDELQSKRKTIKNNKAQIHSDPNMYYDVFFKIITTVGFSGFTDISYTSKVNGKYHTQNINLPEKGTRSIQPSDNNLNLTVAISKDYLEIWARGGSLPKIFY
ncbi:MAG: fibrobacter succinogenes major paralogous domain-containing protein, partial [Fibromonadaceae bacterium]|nr:fibrobacter succinogenes major paralogous domain-containing protein [Fibromonadaceae bacterium]